MRKILLIFVFNLYVLQQIKAQRQFAHNELGFFLGTAFYMGDLNPYSPINKYVKPALGIVYRRIPNPRFAYKTSFYYGKVSDSDGNSRYLIERLRGLSFVSPVYELSQQLEFNFFPYEIGNPRLYYTTPYTFIGISGFYYSPKSNGNKLNRLENEGRNYSPLALSLPMGLGFKVDIADRLGLSFEFGMRRTWTDYLDDVSKTYIDAAVTAANPAGASIGRQRGNARSKDWYTFAGVIISFRLDDRLALCPAYN